MSAGAFPRCRRDAPIVRDVRGRGGRFTTGTPSPAWAGPAWATPHDLVEPLDRAPPASAGVYAPSGRGCSRSSLVREPTRCHASVAHIVRKFELLRRLAPWVCS